MTATIGRNATQHKKRRRPRLKTHFVQFHSTKNNMKKPRELQKLNEWLVIHAEMWTWSRKKRAHPTNTTAKEFMIPHCHGHSSISLLFFAFISSLWVTNSSSALLFFSCFVLSCARPIMCSCLLCLNRIKKTQNFPLNFVRSESYRDSFE